MSGLNRSIEYLSSKFNNAKDTKQSIITAANSYDCIKKNIKEEKIENIKFDPLEIETIVFKDREVDER